MPTHKKRPDFFTSEEGTWTLHALQAMDGDKTYNTDASYSANTGLYPNNLIPFVDKHMAYLRDHPVTDPKQYIANLRLMTRAKSPAR